MRKLLACAFIYFALLFSSISHAEHLSINDLYSEHVAEQSCNFCQQNIDNTNTEFDVNQPFFFYYSAFIQQIYVLSIHTNYSISPPLRAPPALQFV